jgi:surfactin synthase thioesterase subunit
MTAPPQINTQGPNAEAPVRLLCLPYAGAGASVFGGWLRAAPPGLQVCPVQLPGRENRLWEPPFTELAPLVRGLADAAAPLLDRPLALFGHSMGALLGFELARELRRRAASPPVALFLSAHRAPHLPSRSPTIHHLPDSEFIQEVTRRYQAIPAAVLQDAELMRLLLPGLKADFGVLERYVYAPEAPLECPLTVFGGEADPTVTGPELEAWRDQTTGPFHVRLFPGDHFFLRTQAQPLLSSILGTLTDA